MLTAHAFQDLMGKSPLPPLQQHLMLAVDCCEKITLLFEAAARADHGELKAGERVLINGASGGVGTYTVQLAKAMGAHVTGVCSGRNVEMVRSIGADRVINYKEEDYTESGLEFDLIIDMVGNHSPAANQRLLSDDGRLIIVGGAKGNWFAPFIGMIKASWTS